jgi:uncharacterized low-complexity protein
MTPSHKTPVAIALGTALAGGLVLSGSAFAITPLAQGYLLGAQQAASAAADKAKEGSCGGDKSGMKDKHAEGTCGEGCGMQTMDTDKDGRISSAEFAAAHEGDSSRFGAHDPDRDGFISADEMEAMHPDQSGDDRKPDASAGKAAMEGKCGEGMCGGEMQAGAQ